MSPNFSYETKIKNLKTDKNIFNNLIFFYGNGRLIYLENGILIF